MWPFKKAMPSIQPHMAGVHVPGFSLAPVLKSLYQTDPYLACLVQIIVNQNDPQTGMLALAGKLDLFNKQGAVIMATLADVQASVAAEKTVVASVVALLTSLSAKIAALAPNQAAIDQLAADVAADTKSLSDAVVANTPAGP